VYKPFTDSSSEVVVQLVSFAPRPFVFSDFATIYRPTAMTEDDETDRSHQAADPKIGCQ
jgi:hypothetical protein